MPKLLKLSLFINLLRLPLTFCCLTVALLSPSLLSPQLWQCPHLPFLLRSNFSHPVRSGCARDDCIAVKTAAMVLIQNETNGRVACHPGLCGALKSPGAFRMWIWIVPAGLAGRLAGPTDPQRRGEEKHVTAVWVWVHYHYREMKGNTRRDGGKEIKKI